MSDYSLLQGIGAIGNLGLGIADMVNSANAAKETRKAKQQYLNDSLADIGNFETTANQNLNDYYTGLSNSQKSIRDFLTGTDYNALTNIDFNKDNYNVDDYYAKNKNSLLDNAMLDTGLGRSSAAQQNAVNAGIAKSSELYRDALSAMQNDRNFDLSLAEKQAAAKKSAFDTQLSSLGSLYEMDKENLGRFQDNTDLSKFLTQSKVSARGSAI